MIRQTNWMTRPLKKAIQLRIRIRKCETGSQLCPALPDSVRTMGFLNSKPALKYSTAASSILSETKLNSKFNKQMVVHKRKIPAVCAYLSSEWYLAHCR